MRVNNVVLAIAIGLLAAGVYQPALAVEIGVGVNIDLPVITFHAPPELAVITGTYAYYVPDADDDIFFYEGLW